MLFFFVKIVSIASSFTYRYLFKANFFLSITKTLFSISKFKKLISKEEYFFGISKLIISLDKASFVSKEFFLILLSITNIKVFFLSIIEEISQFIEFLTFIQHYLSNLIDSLLGAVC